MFGRFLTCGPAVLLGWESLIWPGVKLRYLGQPEILGWRLNRPPARGSLSSRLNSSNPVCCVEAAGIGTGRPWETQLMYVCARVEHLQEILWSWLRTAFFRWWFCALILLIEDRSTLLLNFRFFSFLPASIYKSVSFYIFVTSRLKLVLDRVSDSET